MKNNKTLSVIVPFFNEEDYLAGSINRLLEVNIFDKIILVDDKSSDSSINIAKDFADKYKNIVLLQTKRNSGKGTAVKKGLEMIDSTHVIVHDADLEYFPDDIPEMFNVAINNPNSLILGSRVLGEKERKNLYFITYLINRLFSIFFSLINMYKVSDISTCYQLSEVKTLRELNIKEKGFSLEVEILSKALRLGIEIYEVPIKYHGRSYEDGKKIKIKDAIKIFYKMVTLSKLNIFFK